MSPSTIALAETDRTWIATYTGKVFWPVNPRVQDVCIYDIGHALANTCRWSGHCVTHYSVAQHSVEVARYVALRNPDNRRAALAGLLHDASEAYINDIARPTKPLLANYREIEAVLMGVINEKFGLQECDYADVGRADTVLLHTEARDIMPRSKVKWIPKDVEMLHRKLRPLSPKAAESEFLGMFGRLTGDWVNVTFRHQSYRVRDWMGAH